VNARTYAVLITVSILLGCSAHTEKSVRNDQRTDSKQPGVISAQESRVPPGHCRIIGTLVGIDSTLVHGGPCSKAPCRGLVRVDSILGYGSAFGSPLALKEEINVHFAFTLAATSKDLFPNMTERLPGLEIGARFEADVESRNEPGMGERRASYIIQEYTKMN
jgi:hypothetical protein